jgi:citrate synthase
VQQLVAAPEGVEKAAAAAAQRYRSQKLLLPGFGHHLHRPDDPRSPALFGVAEKQGLAGKHVAALRAFAREVDKAYGKHITINATGAIGALMLDIDVPLEAIRCFSVVARSAGLTAHLLEEKSNPAARVMWKESRNAVPYVAP